MSYLFWLLSGLFLFNGRQADEAMVYVRVPYHSAKDLKLYVEKGFDVAGINLEEHRATLLVKKSAISSIHSLNVLSMVDAFGPDKEYKKPEDVERILKSTATQYPNLARVEGIGKSLEGRNVYAIELTDRSGGDDISNRPSVLFDAMHHAREVMTPEVALDIVEYLTSRFETDAEVRRWLTSYRIWVIPMNNPDGNNRVWTGSTMWRKNTRGGHGVDINRNYPYEWNGCDGSSSFTGADDYHGTGPASEPETNNIMALAKRIHPVFNISYHSFSEIVIYPFGCDPKRIPESDRSVYEGVGKELASRLVTDTGRGRYTAGTSYELLYNVDGGSIDWMYTADKIMSFVVEVNSDVAGFQPSYKAYRDKTVLAQREGWKYILNRMDGPGIRFP